MGGSAFWAGKKGWWPPVLLLPCWKWLLAESRTQWLLSMLLIELWMHICSQSGHISLCGGKMSPRLSSSQLQSSILHAPMPGPRLFSIVAYALRLEPKWLRIYIYIYIYSIQYKIVTRLVGNFGYMHMFFFKTPITPISLGGVL